MNPISEMMAMNNGKDYGQLPQILQDAKTVAIAGHVNPDGDAVSSCLALALCMRGIGKSPIVLLEGFSSRFHILPGREMIYQGSYEDVACDAFIALDTSTKDRLGEAVSVFDRAPLTINIDHHISNTLYARHNFVGEASSTAEMVYGVTGQFCPMNVDIAACIYAGLLSDTGGFRHSSTTSETYSIAARLLETGMDFSHIYREVMEMHSIAEVNIMARALSKLTVLPDIGLSYTVLTLQDMREAGADFSDLDGIVEYMLNIRGVRVSLLVTERGGDVSKASLRAVDLNVNQIAGLFGGGGHAKAAGATINQPIGVACEQMLAAIREAVQSGGLA